MQHTRNYRKGIVTGIGIAVGLCFCITTAHAQIVYTNPLTNIPGVTDDATLKSISETGLVGFINGMMRFIFTAAAIASVVMIVIIGFQYVVAEKSAPNVSALRDKIKAVAAGVALIASTWIILSTVNPNIVTNLNIFAPSRTTGTSTSPSSPPRTTNPSFDPKLKTFNEAAGADAEQNAAIYRQELSTGGCTTVMERRGQSPNRIYTVYCLYKSPN